MKETMMENTPLFSVLTEEQRTIIAERMSAETRRGGDVVYQQGRPATALYLIREGWARLVTDQFAVLANLSAGSLLGDADVISGRNYSTSAEAATDLSLWSLSASDLKAIMADHPEIGRSLKRSLGVSEDQTLERHLRRMDLLAGLSSEQLREVASYLRPEHFAAGQVIYRRATEGDTLYLVDQGRVQVTGPTGVLADLDMGGSFGEGAFLTGETRSTEAAALTDVTVWSLARNDFEQLALRFPILALNLSRLVTRKLRERTLRAGATVQVIRPPAPAMSIAPAVEIGRAADSATSWWRARSAGAKFRLITVTLLLIWLVFVSGSFAIRSLLSQTDGISMSNAVARASVSERAILVALAADLPVDVTPTFTPWPTETPVPTATFTPTATPTNTPIPTATFTPTATPTSTPVPTNTPVPVRAVAQAQAPAAAAAAAPAPVAAPVPSVKYKLIEMRRLDACENRGKHNIFVKVVDAAGAPVDGVTVVQIPAGQPGNVLDKMVSGTKGPGQVEFIMWKMAEYGVYISEDGVNPTSTDIAQPVHSNFADESNCADGGGGNTLFHNSFSLVFQKTS